MNKIIFFTVITILFTGLGFFVNNVENKRIERQAAHKKWMDSMDVIFYKDVSINDSLMKLLDRKLEMNDSLVNELIKKVKA